MAYTTDRLQLIGAQDWYGGQRQGNPAYDALRLQAGAALSAAGGPLAIHGSALSHTGTLAADTQLFPMVIWLSGQTQIRVSAFARCGDATEKFASIYLSDYLSDSSPFDAGALVGTLSIPVAKGLTSTTIDVQGYRGWCLLYLELAEDTTDLLLHHVSVFAEPAEPDDDLLLVESEWARYVQPEEAAAGAPLSWLAVRSMTAVCEHILTQRGSAVAHAQLAPTQIRPGGVMAWDVEARQMIRPDYHRIPPGAVVRAWVRSYQRAATGTDTVTLTVGGQQASLTLASAGAATQAAHEGWQSVAIAQAAGITAPITLAYDGTTLVGVGHIVSDVSVVIGGVDG